MKFGQIKQSEKGYMLLESLVTLTVLVTIILMIFPLIADWVTLRNSEKDNVEHARLLYELSMNWQQELFNETYRVRNVDYYIESLETEIIVSNDQKQIGVAIYEVEFD